MKKILLFAISAMLVMAGCGKSDTDDNPNKPNKPDSENPEKPDEPDDPDSGKLPELPDPTDVCSGMDDIEFMKYCYEHFDVNKDGKISEQEYNAVKEIDCDNLAISSFKGIEYFANLETFSCRENTKIKTIDLSHNKKITSIVENAFYNCKSLTSIAIPDSVAEIGNSAFYGCTGLTSITISDSVTKIGGHAFSGCTGLTSITIPNSVTEIGDFAFWGCTGKLYVNCDIPNGRHQLSVPYYSGPFLFSMFTEIIIGDGVKSIGDYAFHGCNGLTSVTIGKGVAEIGESAFEGCTSLTSVTIPDGVAEIGESAFEGCTSLTSVTIPDGVNEIGDSAFKGCTGLTSVTIGKGVTEIGDGAFWGCTGLKAFYGKYASEDNRCVIFDGVLKSFAPAELTTYVIPYSVTKISSYVFRVCTGLTSVTIPDSVTEIGDSAFYGCTGMTSITIPNSVAEVGRYAFYGCTSLTRVTIPDSVIKIGGRAFSGCTGTLYVNCNIPDGKFNGRNSFVADVDNCSVPFANSKFMDVIIGNNVKYIGTNAFYKSSLSRITIGKSVESIGYLAFYDCPLESVYCKATIPPTLYADFISDDAKIYVPCASLDAYRTADVWKNYAKQIEGYDFE